jgi:hypothetical protein
VVVISKLTNFFSEVSDLVLSEENIHLFEKLTIIISIISFLAHLFIISIVTYGLVDIPGIEAGNYLKALATPFSFILIFEVFILLVSVRESILVSLGRQFQVISLVIIRNVFKDIGQLGTVTDIPQDTQLIAVIFLYIGTAITMFLGTSIYYLFIKKLLEIDETELQVAEGLQKIEKTITLGLIIFFIIFSFFYFISVDNILQTSIQFTGFNLDGLFKIIFTMMIFADVLILLINFIYNNSFTLIFRNASIVVASILLRLGLTTSAYWDKTFVLSGLFLGLVTIIIYYYIRNYEIKFNRRLE